MDKCMRLKDTGPVSARGPDRRRVARRGSPASIVDVIDPATQAVLGHRARHGRRAETRGGDRGGRKAPSDRGRSKDPCRARRLAGGLARPDDRKHRGSGADPDHGTGQAARRRRAARSATAPRSSNGSPKRPAASAATTIPSPTPDRRIVVLKEAGRRLRRSSRRGISRTR